MSMATDSVSGSGSDCMHWDESRAPSDGRTLAVVR